MRCLMPNLLCVVGCIQTIVPKYCMPIRHLLGHRRERMAISKGDLSEPRCCQPRPVVNDAKASVLLPPPPPKVPVVPPRPLPAPVEELALPLPKFLPTPDLPLPPPPIFPPGLPPTLSYGPLQPPEFYPKRASHPYLKPKATTRYPFREVSRAT